MVINQHRFKNYPYFKDVRITFPSNQIHFAEKRDICIIPSCILFECINEKFNGQKISRWYIENIIVNSKGVLTKI